MPTAMPEAYRYSFPAMGGDCLLLLFAESEDNADEAAAAAEVEVARIERRYSRYRDDSDLVAINRVAEAGGSIEVDDETAGLLEFAWTCHRLGGGLFDISSGRLRAAWPFTGDASPQLALIESLLADVGLDKVGWEPPRLTFSRPGMALDFGGIGKEYAADRAGEICAALGIRHGFVDLGGDIHVIGPQPDGSPWRIGIRHPRLPETVLATLAVGQGGVATSGDYERFIEIDGQRHSHILDPFTGWPVRGLSSVTAVADRCLVAGSVTTIAMLKGRSGVSWLQGLAVGALWMDDAGERGCTPLLAFSEDGVDQAARPGR